MSESISIERLVVQIQCPRSQRLRTRTRILPPNMQRTTDKALAVLKEKHSCCPIYRQVLVRSLLTVGWVP